MTVLDDISKLVEAQTREIAEIEQSTEQISLNINEDEVRSEAFNISMHIVLKIRNWIALIFYTSKNGM